MNEHVLKKKQTFRLALSLIFQFGFSVHQQDQPAAAFLVQQGGARYKPRPPPCGSPSLKPAAHVTCSRLPQRINQFRLLEQVSVPTCLTLSRLNKDGCSEKHFEHSFCYLFRKQEKRHEGSSDHRSARWG